MIHPENTEIERFFSSSSFGSMLSFLDKEYKEVVKQEFGSTAAAAKRVAENPEKNMPQLPIYMLLNFTI